jgi:TPR repeat protein
MTHATRFVTVAVLIALVLLNVSCEVQTPEIDALRARAEAGDAEAQYLFGNMYAFGLGGFPQDDAEAMRWHRLAADQGHAGAQYELGNMYATGRGVPLDYVEAHMWCNLAVARFAGNDRDRVVKNRDINATKMTAEQIAEAQRRAREWGRRAPA